MAGPHHPEHYSPSGPRRGPSLPGPGQTERRFRADDGVHFSDIGYRTIARLAFASIAQLLPAFAEPLNGAAEALTV